MRWRRGDPPAAGPATYDGEPGNPTAMLDWCRRTGVASRPHYRWGVLQAASSADALGIERITVIEFGVAGGNGLVALEAAAAAAESLLRPRIDVVGFDIGSGMPTPVDHRDLPWAIPSGIFAMDEAALAERLARARLVIGPVERTVPDWLSGQPGVVGFAAFDLDLYSATMAAFGVLDAPVDRLLPRVVCYFDDLFGIGWSDFAGERAAIADFNDGHPHRKIGPIHGLKYQLPPDDFTAPWPEQLYLAHIFDSPRYNELERPVAPSWEAVHRLSPRG